MKRISVALLLVTAGCSTKLVDPCAHQAGACLALHIDASATVSRLSSAQVHVTGEGIDVAQTVGLQNGADSTDLPVALAVVFNDLASSTNVHVDVRGLLAGTAVGETGVDSAVAPGTHRSRHVQLDRIANQPDLGTQDGDAPADMTSTDLAGYVPLTVQLAGSGSGSVNGTGLTCSGHTCSGNYPLHSTVMIGETAAANATFAGWSGGGCAGTGTSCSVTLDQPTTVMATFDWKFVPSHVAETAYKTNAANLSGVTSIDTHSLTINGAAPPNGVTFEFQSGIAVLSVGQWTVDKNVAVAGDAPLVVVAAGPVVIGLNASIDASAKGTTAGPGGNAVCAMGAGGSAGLGARVSGGGGEYGGGASAGGGAAGASYGGKVTDFCGGSPGGDGGTSGVGTCTSAKTGGAGGGAVQVSSVVSITIQGSSLSGGFINAGGGGGAGACFTSIPNGPSSGANAGGGGSGGEVFLEAPTISIAQNGAVSANGGGGGGAVNKPGADGSSALYANAAAGGGAGVNASESGGAGAFSPNGANLTPATPPNPATVYGGGGGVGRIWLRTRGTAANITNASISPPPMVDTSL